MKKLLLIPLLVLICSVPATAQQEQEVAVKVHFPQSISVLRLNYADNQTQLDTLFRRVGQYNIADTSRRGFTTVNVVGGASPEGSVRFNRSLSQKRAAAIFDYIENSGAVKPASTDFTYLGRDWHGLRSLVEADSAVPSRDKVLILLDTIIARNGSEEPLGSSALNMLKELDGGVPYYYMYHQLFPALRASTVIVHYNQLPAPLYISTPLISNTTLPSPEILTPYIPVAPTKICKPFYMSLRTNMLYDAAAIPNIGAEFYLGKNWSVQANWSYGWWDVDRRHRYWRAYGGDLGFRRWFGSLANEKPLTGHHLGAFFGVITYDFEFGGRGHMGGLPGRNLWDRCNFVGGIEYGYSLPVARRLNIDFTLGVGYIGGKYIDYVPDGDRYLYQRTRRLNWVGPTKLEVSLVWLIGCDNYNRR